MARILTASSGHYLENTSAVLTAAPITLACWYKPVATNVGYYLMQQGIVDSADEEFALYHNGTNVVVAQTRHATSAVFAISSAGTSAGTWTHACAVFASSSSRAAYINGGSKGTDTTSSTPTSLNDTILGARYTGVATRGTFLDGSIAEAAIWNVALSDSEVASLYVSVGVGIYPTDVRPANLVAYWPLLGDNSPEPDDVGTKDLTVSGAVQGTHLTMQHLNRFWLMGPLPA